MKLRLSSLLFEEGIPGSPGFYYPSGLQGEESAKLFFWFNMLIKFKQFLKIKIIQIIKRPSHTVVFGGFRATS